MASFLGSNLATAQGLNVELFGYPGSDRQGLYELTPLPNGNVLMFGHNFAGGDALERGGRLLTLDQRGQSVGQAARIVDGFGQVKDVLVDNDGRTEVLISWLDLNDFKDRFGMIERAPDGTQIATRSWFGNLKGITRGREGATFGVGQQNSRRGLFTKFSSDGEVEFMRALGPMTPRPAGLLDVVTLANGDLLAFGFITTSIGGVPQPEITLLRFTPAGDLLWSKKITRGKFFSDDGLSMFLRSPTRIHLDAAENIHLITYLGAGGGTWRTHLIKLSSDGELIHSTAYVTSDQFAGQGAVSVLADGQVMLAFETITDKENHSLTALLLAADGTPIQASRINGTVFDVSGIAPTPGAESFLITGTTLDCDTEARATYLTELHVDGLYFGTDVCNSELVSYARQRIDVEVLPVVFELEDVPIVTSPALNLGPATVTRQPVDCLAPNEKEPESSNSTITYTLCSSGTFELRVHNLAASAYRWSTGETGESISVSEFGSYTAARTNECQSDTINFILIDGTAPLTKADTVIYFCPGSAARYDQSPDPDIWALSQVQWKDGGRELVRTWSESAVDTLVLMSRCGIRDRIFRIVQLPAPGTEILPTELTQCNPSDTVWLAIPTDAAGTVEWADGSTENPRTVTTPGAYRVTVTNNCGVSERSFVVTANYDNEPLATDTERIDLCYGEIFSYPTATPNVTQTWLDGYPEPGRTFTENGTYVLTRNDGCSVATTEVRVNLTDCCQIYLPTAFSPNEDGVNDAYEVLPAGEGCGGLEELTFVVYDRWGSTIFASSAGTTWDGMIAGRRAGLGEYLVVVTYLNGGRRLTRSQAISLVR
ncbi:T9SS type B sorting domain-containing protein [Neolewinella antarctica]|uniref:Gliding motility-associated-like protein n=1 Tax=Neolewinella antarctica TaxID=442734 RepID=A0ABX0XEL9_9BACT|nr:gliding motility-associated C-terminal domain-containing protein [Neolewinella antarctica]NJC27349.1 gliding motility-associated-like protein [Neolewinella antarctica]